jgi:RimJ/RimL family protein N-acetyltransferase
VLVLMGGTDPANVTIQALDGLRQHPLPPGAEVAVVVGRSNPHRRAIEAGVAALGPGARLLVEPADLPDWLRWADLAVSAGGTTVWELCALGVPALLVTAADNQRPNVVALARAGAALDLGEVAELDPARIGQAVAALAGDAAARGAMAERGRELVDGQGTRRVLTALAARERLRLRPARRDDAERLFAWANDPVTREMSFQGETIPWATHLRWLESSLGRPDRRLWIAEWRAADDWVPFGQVRLDRGGVLSLGLDPAWRGRGLAAPVIRRALAEPESAAFGPVYTAFIRPENQPSRRAFRQAGFVDRGDDEAGGVACRRYVRDEGLMADATGGEP